MNWEYLTLAIGAFKADSATALLNDLATQDWEPTFSVGMMLILRRQKPKAEKEQQHGRRSNSHSDPGGR